MASAECEGVVDVSSLRCVGALVLGASGEVGKELVRVLLENNVFQRLVLIGRKEMDLSTRGDKYKDVIQKVVDFEKLSEHKEAFEGCEVGFCCLGTTRGKSGAEGFYRVDHDYVLESARMAKEAGCRHFNLVTSKGANASTPLLYLKTKGQVEADVTKLEFERLSIFRPATLLCDREEQRTGEKFFKLLLKPVTAIAPTWITVTTTDVAKAMTITAFLKPKQEKVEILENATIHAVAKDFDRNFKQE